MSARSDLFVLVEVGNLGPLLQHVGRVGHGLINRGRIGRLVLFGLDLRLGGNQLLDPVFFRHRALDIWLRHASTSLPIRREAELPGPCSSP